MKSVDSLLLYYDVIARADTPKFRNIMQDRRAEAGFFKQFVKLFQEEDIQTYFIFDNTYYLWWIYEVVHPSFVYKETSEEGGRVAAFRKAHPEKPPF